MRRSMGLLLTVMLILMLDGCGNSGNKKSVQPSVTPQASSGPGYRPGIKIAKVGQPFAYQYIYTDGSPPVDWQITVDKIACGISVLPKAANNPAWRGGDDPPEYIDATPPAGQQFCEVSAIMRNVGTTPGSATNFDNIVLDKGEFQASSRDDQVAHNLNGALKSDDNVNPGGVVQRLQIWTVPIGAKPLAVLFPMTNVVSGPTYRIEVA